MERDPAVPARREVLKSVLGLTVALGGGTLPSTPAAQGTRTGMPPRFMYVGCFSTKDRGRGEGISLYRRASGSDRWSLVEVLKEEVNPSFLAMAPDGRSLYTVHGGIGSHASAYRIDGETGRLSRLNQQPVKGSNPVHLAIDASHRFLVVANYATGGLAVLPINPDGSLAPLSHLLELSGTPGPHKQQTGANPHACPFDPTGRYVVVPDKGVDRVVVIPLDTASGTLRSADQFSAAARAGAGPRHVDFHPTRPYAYVINELDSTITTYAFRPDQRVLEPLQILTTLPARFTGDNTGAEIFVAPSGRFLYGSNRGHDSIAMFAIDDTTGELTSVGWEPTQGRTPRFFGLDPAGEHLYAANQADDTIVIFRIDQASGRLSPTGEILRTPTPCTIVFR
ncbi:MAG: lactonase family protein [Chloroflexi bacterium]|nr:lactonase family protein [Chloroflexota bacterium]